MSSKITSVPVSGLTVGVWSQNGGVMGCKILLHGIKSMHSCSKLFYLTLNARKLYTSYKKLNCCRDSARCLPFNIMVIDISIHIEIEQKPRNGRLNRTKSHLTPTILRTPEIILHRIHCQKLQFLGYILSPRVWVELQ